MFIELITPEYENKFNSYLFDESQEKIDAIGPINSINILVGSNNSGKSRFMRELMNYQSYNINENYIFFAKLKELKKKLNQFHENSKLTLILDVNKNYRNYDGTLNASIAYNILDKYHNGIDGQIDNTDFYKKIEHDLQNVIININKDNHSVNTVKRLINDVNFLIEIANSELDDFSVTAITIRGIGTIRGEIENLTLVSQMLSDLMEAIKFKQLKIKKYIYIPILRTAKAFNIQQPDIYETKTRTDYSIPNEVEIFTGLTLYQTIQADKGSSRQIRKRMEDFELFLSETFFDGEKIELTALKEKNNVIAITINEEIERDLHDVGDGVDAIIVLMYKLFLAEDYSWIFIEEPEINLHPAFQRIFLYTLLNNEVLSKKRLKIFFTTHSNHLLDMTIENSSKISIFILNQALKADEEYFYIRNVKNRDLKILNNLGVLNSSVFLANCTIWVEGVTDRKYIKSYLNAYINSDEFDEVDYKEDLHFSFFEYAGANLSHYEFSEELEAKQKIDARFLSNRIFLLADQDEDKENKHKKLLGKVGGTFKYEVTKGIEIENLISKDLLKLVMKKLSRKFKDEDIISINFDEKKLLDTRLGAYLKSLFGVDISEKGGTLKQYYKDKLAEEVSNVATWENMSKDAKQLTKRIYEFIKENNKS